MIWPDTRFYLFLKLYIYIPLFVGFLRSGKFSAEGQRLVRLRDSLSAYSPLRLRSFLDLTGWCIRVQPAIY
jgi:hypothetical protein